MVATTTTISSRPSAVILITSSRSTRGHPRHAWPPHLLDAGPSVLIRRGGRETVHFHPLLTLTAGAACSGYRSVPVAPERCESSWRRGESSLFLPCQRRAVEYWDGCGKDRPANSRLARQRVTGASATGLS